MGYMNSIVFKSLKEYDDSLGELAEGEPAILVRMSELVSYQ